MPFWPGGLEDTSSSVPEELEGEFVAERKGIRTIPPGFTRGLRLPGEEDEAELDGLDGIRGHSAVGRVDVVSIPYSKPYLLGSRVSLSHHPHVGNPMARLSSEARKLTSYCRHR